MKWKHKLTGWIAGTYAYSNQEIQSHMQDERTIVVENLEKRFTIPIELVTSDANWEEIADDRWLDMRCTVEEFMKAYEMVAVPDGSNHDSYVAKRMVEDKIMKMYGFETDK